MKITSIGWKGENDSSVQRCCHRGNAQDEFLCAISVQRSQLFSIHLIFFLSFQSCPFQNSSQQYFWTLLIISFAKTNQQRSVYSAGQSAETPGIGQRPCLYLDGLWLVGLAEVTVGTILEQSCCHLSVHGFPYNFRSSAWQYSGFWIFAWEMEYIHNVCCTLIFFLFNSSNTLPLQPLRI